MRSSHSTSSMLANVPERATGVRRVDRCARLQPFGLRCIPSRSRCRTLPGSGSTCPSKMCRANRPALFTDHQPARREPRTTSSISNNGLLHSTSGLGSSAPNVQSPGWYFQAKRCLTSRPSWWHCCWNDAEPTMFVGNSSLPILMMLRTCSTCVRARA